MLMYIGIFYVGFIAGVTICALMSANGNDDDKKGMSDNEKSRQIR